MCSKLIEGYRMSELVYIEVMIAIIQNYKTGIKFIVGIVKHLPTFLQRFNSTIE